jgi:hypothetical protein
LPASLQIICCWQDTSDELAIHTARATRLAEATLLSYLLPQIVFFCPRLLFFGLWCLLLPQ